MLININIAINAKQNTQQIITLGAWDEITSNVIKTTTDKLNIMSLKNIIFIIRLLPLFLMANIIR